MTDGNAEAKEPTLFSAVLTPHRSLGPVGFLVLMSLLGALSFAAGIVFYLIGAWPIVGFLGLDVLLVYLAFRANYRAATAYETLVMTPSELRFRKVSHRGAVAEWKLNPVWVKLDRETHGEFGIERLFLVSHGRRVPVAGFLGAREKEAFALAFSAALAEARRGPTRTVVPGRRVG
jgi:uncharacterized membrane protein